MERTRGIDGGLPAPERDEAEALRRATRRADRRRIALVALLFGAGGGAALGLGLCMTDAMHCGMFNVFGGGLLLVAAGFVAIAFRG